MLNQDPNKGKGHQIAGAGELIENRKEKEKRSIKSSVLKVIFCLSLDWKEVQDM